MTALTGYTEEVALRAHGPTLIITLDRDDKRNAIDADMTLGIEHALDLLESESAFRAGVVAGAGRAFCAGSNMYETGPKQTVRGGAYGITRRRRTKPLIAAVEKAALGGGLEIVLSCELAVAGLAATFGLPETRRGLVATSGALFRAPRRLPRAVAAELLFTGAVLDAERTYQVGLINRLVETGRAEAIALELAERCAESGPIAVAETLTVLADLFANEEAAGGAATDRAREAILAQGEADEGRTAFVEKWKPRWIP